MGYKKTKDYVDLTTAQSVEGEKTFNDFLTANATDGITSAFGLGSKSSVNRMVFGTSENAFILLNSSNAFAGIRCLYAYLNPTTFANLPSGGALSAGNIAIINDAGTVITYRGTAAGGGSNVALVMYDGSNWIYH